MSLKVVKLKLRLASYRSFIIPKLPFRSFKMLGFCSTILYIHMNYYITTTEVSDGGGVGSSVG